jgi:hypothetical protein
VKPKSVNPFNRPTRSLVRAFHRHLLTVSGTILLVIAISAAVFAPEFVFDAHASQGLIAPAR